MSENANTELRTAYRRIESIVVNITQNQPEHEPACTPYLAQGLEQIANIAINARADARACVEKQEGAGWWPKS